MTAKIFFILSILVTTILCDDSKNSSDIANLDFSRFLDTSVRFPLFEIENDLEKTLTSAPPSFFKPSSTNFASRNRTSRVRRTRNTNNRQPTRQRIVRQRIGDRNVDNREPGQEAVVIGTHLGQDIGGLLRKNFADVFTPRQIRNLRAEINRAVSQTALGFRNSAFVIDAKEAQLRAFVRADDFAGRRGRSFNRSDLVGRTISVGRQNFNVVSARNFSPIIIDIDQNGKPDVAKNEWRPHAPKFFTERTALFDITGNGTPEFMEWMGPNDALLVFPEIDGSVLSGHNLFGTAGGFRDGYVKLAILFDTDKNGWVEKQELQGLYLWQDRNSDAKAQKEEMTDVISYGIQKICVNHKDFVSHCFIGKRKVLTWDWWPAGFELEQQ